MEDIQITLGHAMLGNYNTTAVNIKVYDYKPALVFYIYMFITAIIMLNLLIALLGDIYVQISENSKTSY